MDSRWRINEGRNSAGGVTDRLLPPNRGDAVAVFFDRALGAEVARILNLSDLVERTMKEARASEGANDAGAE